MAEAQASENQYNLEKILTTLEEDLLDYMDPNPVLAELLKEHSIFRRRKLRDLEELSSRATTTTEKIKAILQLVKERGHDALVVMKRCLKSSGQDTLVRVIEAAEREEDLTFLRKRLETELIEISEEAKICKALREGLINYYREHESTMPVAPLAEQHEAKLIKFYVRPVMTVYKPNAFGQEKQLQEGSVTQKQQDDRQQSSVNTYRQLLFKQGQPYKRIYITAEAGMGKTSFSKMLAGTWCEAHVPDPDTANKFSQDDLETMKCFDLLFLIHLRDFNGNNLCCLDDMILSMLTSNLPRASSYSKEVIERVLCDKLCLIIADGLDEWNHPEDCRSLRSELVPHDKGWQGCSVLTTTRPWKLGFTQLSVSSLERCVQISELDKAASKKLETSTIEFLNENRKRNKISSETRLKNPDDFGKTQTVKELGALRYIPYMLLQIVCLWYEGSPIGKSLCDVYSNIIELTLTRWLVKTDPGHKEGRCNCKTNEIELNCMKSSTHCQREMTLILKIAKLAFIALFNEIKEERLLFDRNFVVQYLSEYEMECCLKIGVLSQVKDTRFVSSVRFKYFFQHKSIQEFFAGVHIALNWNENTSQTIKSICTAVSEVLEMCNVFVFVCGMNPNVYTCISHILSGIVASDPITVAWRSSVITEKWCSEYEAISEYQRMQVLCSIEGERNGHPKCHIILEDVIIESCLSLQSLAKVVASNTNSMKSLRLYFSSLDKIEDKYQHLFDALSRLENLYVRIKQELSCLAGLLTASASTLKCLRIERICLTDNVVRAITDLNHLQSINLKFVSVSCNNLESILKYLNTCKSLNQVYFSHKHCSRLTRNQQQHMSHALQLKEHHGLQHLELSELDINTLNVSFGSLTICNLSTLLLPHEEIKNLLDSVKTGAQLNELTLGIDCTDHPDDCSGFVLDLSRHNNLIRIVFCFPALELHINTDLLRHCYIDCRRLAGDKLLTLLDELHEAPVLEELCLQINISDSSNRVFIPTIPKLTYFLIENSILKEGTVKLSPGLTSLKKIKICKAKINKLALKDLFLSIPKLPLSITVELCDIELTAEDWREVFSGISKLTQYVYVELRYIAMTTEKWRELLFDIVGKLAKSIQVSLISCTRPKEEWELLISEIKSFPDFCVKRDDFYYIEFETMTHD